MHLMVLNKGNDVLNFFNIKNEIVEDVKVKKIVGSRTLGCPGYRQRFPVWISNLINFGEST